MLHRIHKLGAIVGLALIGAQSAIAAAPGAKVQFADGSSATQDTPLAFPPHIMFWGLVTFFLLLVIMKLLVYPTLLGNLTERQERVEAALATAERVNREAAELLKSHEAKMAEAHAAAKKIADESLARAQAERNAKIERAGEEAARIVARAKQEIASAQVEAAASLRQSAVELGLLASSALMKRELADSASRQVAEEAVNRG
jgi:F-type H+-transporting ATPase subunit b